MKKLLTLLLLLLLSSTASWAATYYTFVGGGTSGPWNNSGTTKTWTTDPTGQTIVGSPAAEPQPSDALVILNGYTVLLTANVTTTGHAITIQSGGVLDQAAFSFSANNPALTLSGTGLLRLNSANFPKSGTNTFASAGSLTVEYYDLGANATLPAIGSYKNLLLTNSSGTSEVSLPNNTPLTITGTLTTSRTNSATLTFAARSNGLTLQGNTTLGAGTTLTSSATITSSASITNNGTITSTNAIGFTGASNATLAANGATTFRNLTLNKGTNQQYILSVTASSPGNFVLDYDYNGYIVNLLNGTLKLGSNITLPRLRDNTNGQAGYEIPATAGLWINGADVTLPGAAGGGNKGISGGMICRGLFRISSGKFTSERNDGAVIGDVGSYIIEGGEVKAEKFSPRKDGTPVGSFLMSGGTFSVKGSGVQLDKQKPYARFSIPFSTQTFQMSGGIINVLNTEDYGGIDIATAAGNYSVTGGTFNIVLPPAADAFPGSINIVSTAPFWDLNISEPVAAATTTVAALTTQPLVVLNNLTLIGSNDATLKADAGSQPQNVTVQGTFTINTGAIYLPGTNLTSFTGSKDQTLQIDGTIGVNGTSDNRGLYQMLMDKTNGTLSLAGSATASMRVRNMLTLENGVFNDAGKVLTVLGNVVNSATHTSSGTTTGSITLGGSTLQTLSGDGTGIFGNLIIDNSWGAAGAISVQTAADQTISGKLTLFRAKLFDINTHRLYITSVSQDAISSGPGAFSNTRMILTAGNQSDGGIRKTYGLLTAFVFPVGTKVGTTYYYTPAKIALTVAPTKYGKINVAPVNAVNPFATNKNAALQYYWKVTEHDFSGLVLNKVMHTYSAPNALIYPGNIVTDYVPSYYNPATVTWNTPPATAPAVSKDDVVENATTIDIKFNAVNISTLR